MTSPVVQPGHHGIAFFYIMSVNRWL